MANMSLREFKSRYENGDFESKDVNVQIAAGWYDWFCTEDGLSGRLKRNIWPILGEE